MINKKDYYDDNETNMILSSKLLGEMIGQVKDGLNRIEILTQDNTTLGLAIKNSIDQIVRDVASLEKAIENNDVNNTALIKEAVIKIIKEISDNSKQHDNILKIIESIDQRSATTLTDKIQLITNEIGNMSTEHKIILQAIGNNNDKLLSVIDDKYGNVEKKFDNSSNELHRLFELFEKIYNMASKLDNKFFKIFFVVSFLTLVVSMILSIIGYINSIPK